MTKARLHYLDWLRVIAILGVFLYHTMRPFDLTDWHIKNAELSLPLTAFLLFFAPWGMPFFFLVAGTGTWFALQHRTMRQYANERFKRLLVLLSLVVCCSPPSCSTLSGRTKFKRGC